MAAPYRLTVRRGSKVRRERFDELDAALEALEREMRALAQTERRGTVDLRYREFEPVAQVAARAEVSGPGRLRAGVDLRGDGSAEAFVGRLRRRVVEPRKRESPYDALRRALRQRTSAGP
ncbi:MAG TPA: hypothetical protein VNB64_00585 [Solirubrobacteraceae bacterium]|nr:hypothetical protein [Solirubrobacteraceae bacterium]